MKTKIIYGLIFLFLIFVTICVYFVSKKETVAIIGAMDVEIEEISDNLSNINVWVQDDFKVTTGILGKYRIVLSKSGVGKVNSSTTTQFIIDKFKPRYIINIGIAGGLTPDLKIGDTIIADKMIQYDFDLTALGKPKGYMDDGSGTDKPTIYYSNKPLVDKFVQYKELIKRTGTIATGDVFVIDAKIKSDIQKEFGADAIDMESAAIVQTAKRNNIPVVVLRTISDGVNDTTNDYRQNKTDVADAPALAVALILKSDK